MGRSKDNKEIVLKYLSTRLNDDDPVYIDKKNIFPKSDDPKVNNNNAQNASNIIKGLVKEGIIFEKKEGNRNLYRWYRTGEVREDTKEYKTTPSKKSKSTNQSKDVEFYSPLHRSIQESILSNNLAPFLAFAKTQEAATDERKQLLKLTYDDIQKLITVSVPDFLQK